MCRGKVLTKSVVEVVFVDDSVALYGSLNWRDDGIFGSNTEDVDLAVPGDRIFEEKRTWFVTRHTIVLDVPSTSAGSESSSCRLPRHGCCG